jgi:hypothetical protein
MELFLTTEPSQIAISVTVYRPEYFIHYDLLMLYLL